MTRHTELLSGRVFLALLLYLPVQLVWEAPAQCPSHAEVVARVEALAAARGAVSPDGPPIAARARVVQRSGEFQLELDVETRDGPAISVTTAANCSDLAEATALRLAMELSDRAESPTADELPQRPDPDPRPAEPQSPRATSPPPRQPGSRGRRRALAATYRGALRAWGGPDFLTVAPLSGVLGLSGAFVTRRARAEVSFAHVLAQTSDAEVSGVGVRVRAWIVGARGCYVPRTRWRPGGWVEFPLCAGVDVGALDAVGEGVARPARDQRVWAAACGGPHVAWVPRPRIALWLGGEGCAAISRPQFTVEDLTPVFSSLGASLRALAGVEVRLR